MKKVKITSIGEETLEAIRKGHTNNEAIAKYFTTDKDDPFLLETVGSRVTRLRKQGLVYATRVKKNTNTPLVYKIIDIPYEISDAPVNKRKYKDNQDKTYAELGENLYSCLDFFIYPQKAT